MRLEYCQYHCASCFTSFQDVDAEENLFPGQFLMRSPKGALAFLDIHANHVFDGVNHMVRAHPRMNGREVDTASVFFHNWYGRIAVDPDDDGEYYTVGANPACPHCGGTRTYSLAGSRTGRSAEMPCPPATYLDWIRSGEEEKRKRIENALDACNYLMTPFSHISLRQAQYRCRNGHTFGVAGDFRGPFAYQPGKKVKISFFVIVPPFSVS